MTDRTVIYTDGACHPNPGPGGWGAVIRREGHPEQQLHGGEKDTTNNRMEMLATISALESLRGPSEITLYTDSQYLRNGVLNWMPGWKRNGWRTGRGAPVKNVDLWKRLDKAQERHTIVWLWVRGHTGNEGNELADQLANRGAIELGGATDIFDYHTQYPR